MTSDPNSPTSAPGAADKAADAGRDLQSEARHQAQSLRDKAAREVQARAEGAKDSVAQEVSSVGEALRRASDELREGSPQERAFAGAATALADFADTIQGKDLGEMMHDMSDFGRRNPVAFLGGAALLGFAGARLAKAHRTGPSRSEYGSPGAAMTSPASDGMGAASTPGGMPGTSTPGAGGPREF